MEKFSFEKAQEEANKMQKFIKDKKAKNYHEAAKIIETQERKNEQNNKDNFDRNNNIHSHNEKPETQYTDEYLDYLLDRLEEVGMSKKRFELEDDLIQAIYDSKTKTLEDACRELEILLQLRARSSEFLRANISINEKNKDVINTRLRMIHDIDLSSANQELFLGSGNIARVYSLANQKGLCVKKIVNEISYSHENTVTREAEFMDTLSDFEVAGVRTPYVKETISGGGLTVIIMEELDAVNFESAANGKAPIPKNFDIDAFIDKLKQYINALHEKKGIAHKDLAPRNVMICNKTGNPFVIDFGKSEYLSESKNSELSKDKDVAGIEAIRALMKKSL